MIWGGLGEDITHAVVRKGQLLDAGQRNTLTSLYVNRSRTLSEGELKKRLELMGKIRENVKQADACQLKNM